MGLNFSSICFAAQKKNKGYTFFCDSSKIAEKGLKFLRLSWWPPFKQPEKQEIKTNN